MPNADAGPAREGRDRPRTLAPRSVAPSLGSMWAGVLVHAPAPSSTGMCCSVEQRTPDESVFEGSDTNFKPDARAFSSRHGDRVGRVANATARPGHEEGPQNPALLGFLRHQVSDRCGAASLFMPRNRLPRACVAELIYPPRRISFRRKRHKLQTEYRAFRRDIVSVQPLCRMQTISALSRRRRRHVRCAGVGVPVLKVTASARRSH